MNEYIVGVVRSYADDVAVLALEGGAGEDDTLIARGESADGLFAELSEPVPAVGVGKGNALGHLVDVGFGVILGGKLVRINEVVVKVNYLIAFNVRKVHGFGNKLGDGALPTACWACDQPDMMMLGLWLTCAVRRAVRHCVG